MINIDIGVNGTVDKISAFQPQGLHGPRFDLQLCLARVKHLCDLLIRVINQWLKNHVGIYLSVNQYE